MGDTFANRFLLSRNDSCYRETIPVIAKRFSPPIGSRKNITGSRASAQLESSTGTWNSHSINTTWD